MFDIALILGLKGLKRQLASFGAWLMTLGTLGVFSISLLDSALIPLPGGPDAAIIVLSTVSPAWMPVYALAATVGSAIGSTLLYMAASRAGASALKAVKPEKRERVAGLLGRYDMLAIVVPAVLPPPFPFKVFVLSAGVFKLKIPRFLTAIVIGRAVRFLIEGLLAIEFGKDALNIISRQGVKVLAAVGGVIVISLLVKFFRMPSRHGRRWLKGEQTEKLTEPET
ncbi:MAG TPA: VTT domain-containing protein [Blastocatellia bacterium]|nr:VTT domain-containing protein [Blastocatellia bacterium]